MPSRSQSRSASLAMVSVAVFIGAVVSLHALRPDVDPFRWGMSFYAVGRFSIVMTAAFVAFGVSLLAVVAGLIAAEPARLRPRMGLGLLGLSGTALLGVASFPSNSVPPVTRVDFAHILASMLFFLGFAIGAPLVSWHLKKRRIAGTAAAAFGVTFIATVMSTGSHGFFQRVTVGCALTWVMAVCLALRAQAGDQPLWREPSGGAAQQ